MQEIPQIDFYKIQEAFSNTFYKMPQELFISPLYKDVLDLSSKVLYSFLLDRLTLSQKNNWYDDQGNIYLIFTRKEVEDKLNLSGKTVTKAFKQLTDAKLIYEKTQGFSKPKLIYIGKLQYINKPVSHTRKNYGYIPVNSTGINTEIFPAINTNNINTNISNRNS